jgi:hypothetical protein
MFIENLVPEDYKIHLQNEILNKEFNWKWNEGISSNDTIPFLSYGLSFDKQILCKDAFNLCLPILKYFEQKSNIKIDNIIRSRINLMFQYPIKENEIMNSLHKDFYNIADYSMYSLIYYVNDSEGDNIVLDENKERIVERNSPKAGCATLFKSNMWHTAIPPVNNRKRVTIVFIFKPQQEINL